MHNSSRSPVALQPPFSDRIYEKVARSRFFVGFLRGVLNSTKIETVHNKMQKSGLFHIALL